MCMAVAEGFRWGEQLVELLRAEQFIEPAETTALAVDETVVAAFVWKVGKLLSSEHVK